jgi:hypothetical protein
MKGILAVAIGIGLLVFAGVAGAAVVTSLPEGTIVPMPDVNYFGPGPQSFNGVVWTSTNASQYGGSLFGYTFSYGFNTNGIWFGALGPMAGLNSPSDTMTFTFATPVSGVGGFMNYAPQSGNSVISVYDSSNNLIESYTLNFNTGGATDSGFFFGFLEDSATIKYFTLSNSFIGIANLTTVTATTSLPEFSCVDFESPMNNGPVVVKINRVLPLKANLVDQYGSLLIDSDIISRPVLRVRRIAEGSISDVSDQSLFAGQGTEVNQFVFTSEGKWQFNLMTKNYSAPGTYTISILSGNSSEYVIKPSCTATFVIE